MDDNKKDLLSTCIEMIEHMVTTAEKISTAFRTYNENEGYSNLGTLFGNMGDLVNGITAGGISAIDVREINEHMEQMQEAISNTDVILLADILEYELVEMLNRWKDILLEYI